MPAAQKNFRVLLSGYAVLIACLGSQTSLATTWNIIQNSMKELSGQMLQGQTALDLAVMPGAIGLGLSSDVVTSSFRSNAGMDALRRVLADAGLHPMISLTIVDSGSENTNSLDKSTNHEPIFRGSLVDAAGRVVDYSYRFDGISICRATLRTVTHPSGETVVVGRVPLVYRVSSYGPGEWPNQDFALRTAASSLSAILSPLESQGVNVASIAMKNASRCLSVDQGDLRPVWSFVLEYDLKRFEVEADEHEVMYMQQRFFDGFTGRIQAYNPNILSGALNEFQVPLDGSGLLRNSNFNTKIYGTAKPQVSHDGIFLFSGKDVASAESSTFVYANLQLDYFKSLGASWGDQEQISIYTNVAIKGDTNVASYIPSSGEDSAIIALGTGDGVLFDNLSFDADVMSHELGHHLIFRSIKEANFESMTLHEGLADFFALSRTGDMCVGESVCASGLSSCSTYQQRCLRSADNSLRYRDETYDSYVRGNEPHLTGQLLSGFLWDLRRTNSIPADVLGQYVVQSLSYLPRDAQIKNFLAALLYTDSVHGGFYQTAILAAAEARGLGIGTLGINLADLQSTAAKSESESVGQNTTHVGGSKSSKSGAFGCGAVTGGQYLFEIKSQWIWALMLMCPVFVSAAYSWIVAMGKRRVL